METEKLYYQDPALTEFTATVLTCEPGKAGYLVTLDRTAFYPEGGGQPADWGTLNGTAVTDVHEREGVVFHTCASPLEPGTAVEGVIDWERRFDHMQQHSGEHICSGMICARYHCDNVGFHMGAEIVTIDFNAEIPWEGLLEIEAQANRYLHENHPIQIQVCRGAELEALDYRSKKALEGDVRIVTFPGADAMDAVAAYAADGAAAVMALKAGNDLIITTDYPAQIPKVLEAVNSGALAEETVNTACRRVLTWKQALGLLPSIEKESDAASAP